MFITKLNREQLLMLAPDQVQHCLSREEIIYMMTLLNCFWQYDYVALDDGCIGQHALLKSGLHSDTFFNMKEVLAYPNLCQIFARQLHMRLVRTGYDLGLIGAVAGVPSAATKLGEYLAAIMGVPVLPLIKNADGKIVLDGDIPKKEILLVEDVCSTGTGFLEAVHAILIEALAAQFVPMEMVLINRGGVKKLRGDSLGVSFDVKSLMDIQVQTWTPEECPLCAVGSEVVKPKVSEESWRGLLASQTS